MVHLLHKTFFIVVLTLLVLGVNGQTPACVGESGKVEWMLFDNNIGQINRNQFFPQNPSGIEIIRELETESSFNDKYASLINGFIMVPQSGQYIFNVTGIDYVYVYLSTDEHPENKALLVETSYTNFTQYDKKSAQTDTVNLIAGKYYYFEILHTEVSGSDQLRVSWKPPSDRNTWKTIGEEYIYSYACNQICEPKGTPCDDGDANTINDIEDGACNCIGIPKKLPECAGEYGKIQAFYYDGIPTSNMIDLLLHQSYPLQPSRAENLTEMRMPYQNLNDDFGSTVKAFLRVPITGAYEIGAIGNSRADIYFSKASDLSNLVLIANSSGLTSTMTLNKNEFYYIKLVHKESTSSEEFAAVWKTPFYEGDDWKYIDGAYLYEYGCELACIPEGTPCDDGDSLTIKDTYDDHCNCVGIYCPNGDCEESTKFAPIEICASTNKHGTHPDDSWLSCETTQSKNGSRGNTHWIEYDLGTVMPLGPSHIWNYNVIGQTSKGFRKVAIDLSDNGINWNDFGEFEWEEASGTNEYEGFKGPSFNGKSARYILITSLSNWEDNNCSGFSEMNFKIGYCPNFGTPCDDNDPSTQDDRYDDNCECKGVLVDLDELELSEVKLELYPNPTNNWTNIVFNIPEQTYINLEIFDIMGRLVYQISRNQQFDAGSHQKSFYANNLKNGHYYIRLKTDKNVITEKFLVID